MASSASLPSIGQLRALIFKVFLVAVVRHPIAFIIKGYIVPVAFVAILLNIPKFTNNSNINGVGSPIPIASLADSITDKPLIVVKPPHLGPDVDEVIVRITRPLAPQAVKYLEDENDLLTECLANMRGISPCHASITFLDSPQTNSSDGEHHWNYTIRADPTRGGNPYDVFKHDGNLKAFFLPLQVAVENAMTNSTLTPSVFLYTAKIQQEVDEHFRANVQSSVASWYGFAFFVGFLHQVFHLTTLISKERESGMSQLVDAMGGSAMARLLSSLAVFNVIYFPCWIIFGVLHWNLLWPTTSAAVPIGWQILLGLAVNSSTAFAASFFRRARASAVFVGGAFLLVSIGTMLYTNRKPIPAGVAILSLLFPSANHMLFLQFLCAWEYSMKRANLQELRPPIGDGSVFLTGATLLGFLTVGIIFYPLMAIMVDRLMHGIDYKRRTVYEEPGNTGPVVVEANGLKKTFSPSPMEALFSCWKAKSFTAVNGVDLQGHRGQILCLVGPNGLGKTTTLQMMAGLLSPTEGSVAINALPSQLGICPQRNIFWSELTVKEHLHVWNHIKGGGETNESLDHLLTACDLGRKRHSRAKTLSGGQMRKLQLACMFAGGSSVCLIDECTSGLDPLSRRIIWEILFEQRARRSIIFTTHFLDEVEVLADHIVVLSKGHVKCHGPTTVLKQNYGGGYKVSVPRSEGTIDESYPLTIHQDQFVYTTPDASYAAELTLKLAAAGLTDVSVVGPQVEDVFLHVVADPALTNKADRSSDTDLNLTPGKVVSFWSQVSVIFWKRLLVLKRLWWPYVYVLVLPIVITPALSPLLKGYVAPVCTSIELTLYAGSYFSFYYWPGFPGDVSRKSQPGLLLGGPASVNASLYNLMNNNASVARWFNMSYYNDWIRPVETLDEFMSYINANKSLVEPGGIFMGSNATAPTIGSDAGWGITGGLQMFNPYSQLRSGAEISASYGPMGEMRSRSANVGMFYAVLFGLIQAIYPAAFVLYPSIEKNRNVRAVGYANGARRAPLWVAYALFDFIFVFVIAFAISAPLAFQMPYWTGSAWTMLPILALYGLTSILFSYIFSVVFKSGLTAFISVFWANLLMLSAVVLAFTIPNTYLDISGVDEVMTATTFSLNLLFPIGNIFRACAFGLNAMEIGCRDETIVPPSSIHGYGGPVLYMSIQVAALLGILIWLERDHSTPKLGTIKYNPSEVDSKRASSFTSDEVWAEKARVEVTEEDPLLVLSLTKSFGNNVAVNEITLGIGSGEVLALIGPNGAGKSTLINLIRGELTPDRGNGYLCGEDTKRVSAQRHLGVCPQYDALDLLTTREYLTFFAKIKGVEDAQRNIDLVMAKLGLTPYANWEASKLSGGNKRKLSLAIALMGTPPILVMDEPTSAMDAVAKRAFWNIIQQISPNRSLLLTTHSMEEADALAHRAAVMSQRLLAVGTTQALRQKYSNVYYVQLLLKSAPVSTVEEMTAVRDWVRQTIPGAFIEREVLGGQIRFTVPGSRTSSRKTGDDRNEASPRGGSSNPIVNLIELLEKCKDAQGIDYYSIGGATLEWVFLSIVQENSISAEEEGALKKSWWK